MTSAPETAMVTDVDRFKRQKEASATEHCPAGGEMAQDSPGHPNPTGGLHKGRTLSPRRDLNYPRSPSQEQSPGLQIWAQKSPASQQTCSQESSEGTTITRWLSGFGLGSSQNQTHSLAMPFMLCGQNQSSTHPIHRQSW